jgi:hypothetical protein
VNEEGKRSQEGKGKGREGKGREGKGRDYTRRTCEIRIRVRIVVRRKRNWTPNAKSVHALLLNANYNIMKMVI